MTTAAPTNDCSAANPLSEAERERILSAVDKAFDAQVGFLSDLVGCASLRGQEAEVQALVEAALLERGYRVERQSLDPSLIGKHPAFSPANVSYENFWNVIGIREPAATQGRSLILNAHVDIVPTGDPKRWRYPPFEPAQDGEWLYGRGAGDMKAGLSAAIFALDAIRAAGLELTAPIQIHSVVEEEITGNGAAMALASGKIADAVLIPEPTDEKLVRANSGVIKFGVAIDGTPAHPREVSGGVSALDAAMRLIELLRRLEARWNEERPTKPFFEDVDNPAALTIGTINGGEWIASVPSSCRFEGRIGFYPGDDPHERVKEFEAFVAAAAVGDPLLKRCPPPIVEWVGVVHAGYTLAPGSDAEAVLAEAHAEVNAPGTAPLTAYVMACYLDAAVYAVHAGIPSLVYGPIAENIHAIDERVSLPSLLRVTKAIALFAASWCGVRPLETTALTSTGGLELDR
ncbi:ArgE/DapE family deacylase [Microvirga guangxiensis]|uniref:Acetylornithine deacetylase n=1 Tax=Microvirga guangxiensis TaxID=549386 RepID=A0A1G5LIC7_9HYPH|nr:ArgE/DapE family deacylase [Microvirga guangxiensis]SCZ12058.1 acetylornithine deacetylase [Microvirga guangxiensis]